MSSAYPLLPHERPDVVVAFHQGQPITARRFLSNVAALAALLPEHRHVVNLCTDRYRFAVGLAAALCRGQLSLLPPNETPGVLHQLALAFVDLYCLHDGAAGPAGLPAIAYPDDLGGDRPAPPSPECPAAQHAVLLFTSGSTGRPIPQLRSWGSLVESARAAGRRLGVAGLERATVIGTVPHQHSYGLESTVFLPLQHGLILDSARPLYPADIVACLAAQPRRRILVTTPIHLRAVLADVADLPSVDLVISATAPLSPDLAVETEARFHGPLIEIYGCSETGQLAVRRTALTMEWSCLDGVTLRQDAEGTWAGGPLPAAETLLNDEIELRGAGRFLLHGRKADLVNIAGKRASLAHLNHHLNAIEGVSDGAFIMPEEEGEGVTRLAAAVVAPGLSAPAILAALRRHIDPAFLPRPLVFVDALPRNALGKLPREALLRLVSGRTGRTR
jgi:acyl-coenzyme A synthetase/AMP-(fatty) acid ligase